MCALAVTSVPAAGGVSRFVLQYVVGKKRTHATPPCNHGSHMVQHAYVYPCASRGRRRRGPAGRRLPLLLPIHHHLDCLISLLSVCVTAAQREGKMRGTRRRTEVVATKGRRRRPPFVSPPARPGIQTTSERLGLDAAESDPFRVSPFVSTSFLVCHSSINTQVRPDWNSTSAIHPFFMQTFGGCVQWCSLVGSSIWHFCHPHSVLSLTFEQYTYFSSLNQEFDICLCSHSDNFVSVTFDPFRFIYQGF
jgi:hypothetical protein